MIHVAVPNFGNDYVHSNHETGRIGENLAAYYLGLAGFDASIVDRRGSDIWCQSPEGNMFSVEVKAAGKPILKRHYVTPTYYFSVQTKIADQFMLIGLDANICRIFSKEKLTSRWSSNTIQISTAEFTLEAMQQDFARLVETYG